MLTPLARWTATLGLRMLQEEHTDSEHTDSEHTDDHASESAGHHEDVSTCSALDVGRTSLIRSFFSQYIGSTHTLNK